MTPLATINTTNNRNDYVEQDAFKALYQKLEKGIQSMKNGDIYTIDEA